MFRVKTYTQDEMLTGQMGRDWHKTLTHDWDKRLTEGNSKGSSAAASGGGLSALAILLFIGWCLYSSDNSSSPHAAARQNMPAAEQQEANKSANFRIQQVQLNVRECSSAKCNNLFKVNKGDVVTVLADAGNGWYKIQAGSQSGFARLLAKK